MFAYLSLENKKIGRIVKGTENCLIKDGKMLPDQMRKCQITENDLLESLRIRGERILISKICLPGTQRTNKYYF